MIKYYFFLVAQIFYIDTSFESKPVKPRKKQFEELYKRDTVRLENDFKKSFDEEGAEGKKEKKEGTRIINEALRMYFKEN
ncbi:hypothetical protein QOZ95_003143 [Paenibacillus brasilensis]|uniref:Uncharacterized protein n=1 Tax=Paenibacillus brasilensis TaxID=128574 RepID=A0ABU0L2A0_9BACL|nr:hypothetical protein [Paenibacillus brasilensis]